MHSKYFITASVFIAFCLTGGCRSPDAYRKEADDIAYRNIEDYQEKALGKTEPFTVERPADVLRRKLMIEQRLPDSTNLTISFWIGEPYALSLVDALQVGARNSNDYQDQKDAIFRAALALDLEENAFRNIFGGVLSGMFTSDGAQEPTLEQGAGDFTADVSRQFKQGAIVAGKLGFDVVKLVTGDRSTAYGLLADATVTIPLLRDAGRDIVTEPLAQAQRNLMYSIWNFQKFRQSFGVQVTSEYLGVLQNEREATNAVENLVRLTRNLERSRALVNATRLRETEADETAQNVLRAKNRVVSTRKETERALDGLKITLGLPTDASVTLDESELSTDSKIALNILEGDAASKVPGETESVNTALEHRLDLRTTRERHYDALRKARVARNALEAGLEIAAGASTQERRSDAVDDVDIQFSDGSYNAGINLALPWERTAERNAYRESLLTIDRTGRDFEEAKDGVKRDVRQALRQQREAIEAYRIQGKAVDLAERRVRSTEMFFNAGQLETRLLLDAEEALIQTKNALTQELVRYRIARLSLLRDMGMLEIDAQGIIDEEQL